MRRRRRPADRDGPSRRQSVRGHPARCRRSRMRRFPVLRRSADALVVRSPSDRVSAGGARARCYDREHLPTWFFDPERPSCAGLIARTLARQVGLEAAGAPRRCGRVGRHDRRRAVQQPPRMRSRSREPAQRLAAWLAHGRSPLDTAQLRRVAVAWLARRGRGAAGDRAAARGRRDRARARARGRQEARPCGTAT